jgi:hypothetical protein
MTPTRPSIYGRLGVIIAVAGLAGLVGCGDYQVELGPTIPDDATCPLANGAGGGRSSLSFADGSGTAQGTLPVTTAAIFFPLIVIHGQFTNWGDGNLTVRVWAAGAGTYYCEDPRAAGKTRIVGFGSQSTGVGSLPAYWAVDTLSGGTCSISITHFPGGDSSSLEGNFTATGGGPAPFSGSFVVDNPCY